jgi:hypothetical protein
MKYVYLLRLKKGKFFSEMRHFSNKKAALEQYNKLLELEKNSSLKETKEQLDFHSPDILKFSTTGHATISLVRFNVYSKASDYITES